MAKRFPFSDLHIGHGIIIPEGYAEIGPGCNIVSIHAIEDGMAEEIDDHFFVSALNALSTEKYRNDIKGRFGEDLDAGNRLTGRDLGVGRYGSFGRVA